jgi:hypothetical protein
MFTKCLLHSPPTVWTTSTPKRSWQGHQQSGEKNPKALEGKVALEDVGLKWCLSLLPSFDGSGQRLLNVASELNYLCKPAKIILLDHNVCIYQHDYHNKISLKLIFLTVLMVKVLANSVSGEGLLHGL